MGARPCARVGRLRTVAGLSTGFGGSALTGEATASVALHGLDEGIAGREVLLEQTSKARSEPITIHIGRPSRPYVDDDFEAEPSQESNVRRVRLPVQEERAPPAHELPRKVAKSPVTIPTSRGSVRAEVDRVRQNAARLQPPAHRAIRALEIVDVFENGLREHHVERALGYLIGTPPIRNVLEHDFVPRDISLSPDDGFHLGEPIRPQRFVKPGLGEDLTRELVRVQIRPQLGKLPWPELCKRARMSAHPGLVGLDEMSQPDAVAVASRRRATRSPPREARKSW